MLSTVQRPDVASSPTRSEKTRHNRRRRESKASPVPYIFDFDLTKGILRSKLIGRVTDEVLKDFFRADADYVVRTEPQAGIVDFSETTSFEVSARAIGELAKSPLVLPSSGVRRVVIAPPHAYGLMRMFEIAGETTRPDIHVVRTAREAWAILSVTNPRFEPLE
jgi:hypothetical protein